jgi:hypothetical protein
MYSFFSADCENRFLVEAVISSFGTREISIADIDVFAGITN